MSADLRPASGPSFSALLAALPLPVHAAPVSTASLPAADAAAQQQPAARRLTKKRRPNMGVALNKAIADVRSAREAAAPAPCSGRAPGRRGAEVLRVVRQGLAERMRDLNKPQQWADFVANVKAARPDDPAAQSLTVEAMKMKKKNLLRLYRTVRDALSPGSARPRALLPRRTLLDCLALLRLVGPAAGGLTYGGGGLRCGARRPVGPPRAQ